MFVHCCHCSWCQRESGSAFAVNALIETDCLRVDRGALEWVDTPTGSGRGQAIARCPTCRIALYSHYSAAGDRVAFVRVGTMSAPEAYPPDIHIFTAARQPWVSFEAGTPVVDEYYRRSQYWPPESVERYRAVMDRETPDETGA